MTKYINLMNKINGKNFYYENLQKKKNFQVFS
jgi:hypothetical protein